MMLEPPFECDLVGGPANGHTVTLTEYQSEIRFHYVVRSFDGDHGRWKVEEQILIYRDIGHGSWMYVGKEEL